MKLDEIAKIAGVSRTTCSYVINGKAKQYRISEKTQEKVMAVVRKYNYKPDFAASSLRAGTSRTMGLIIPDLENSSYAKLAKLLEKNARKAGYQLIITCSDDDPKTEMELAKILQSRRCECLLTASVLDQNSDFYIEIQNSNLPVIALDRMLSDEHFASVISEDLEGAYQLTMSLLESRPQHIALLGAGKHIGISKERAQGFMSALKKRDFQGEVSQYYATHFDSHEASAIVNTWIETNTIPEAILTTSYTLLEGLLDAISDKPELMSSLEIATFGDNRLLDFLPIKVNSLSQRFDQIADSALELALNAIAGRYRIGIEVIPRTLIIRAHV